MPAELSGGMKKRIALARTLMLKPDVILYDEPTTGLDPITSKEISNLIISVQKKYGSSSLIITHDIRCVKIVADRIIMLVDGMAYAQGTYEELSKSSDNQVKGFFE
jgi:phospholipid/cholesterol/gamma-HCH transport system ATP-binding protein